MIKMRALKSKSDIVDDGLRSKKIAGGELLCQLEEERDGEEWRGSETSGKTRISRQIILVFTVS